MKARWATLATFSLLVLSFCVARDASVTAQQRPRIRRPAPVRAPVRAPVVSADEIPHRLQGGGRLDADDLLARHLVATEPRASGTLATLGARTIEVTPGRAAPLSALAPALVREQAAISSELARTPGALASPPVERDEVYDLGDRLAVVRTTRVVIADVDAARRVPAMRELLGSRSPSPPPRTAEIERGLADMRAELATAPASHPLRRAAEQGDDALLAAIARGEGELEIVDTFVIPTGAMPVVQGQVQLPRVERERFDYSAFRGSNLRAVVAARDARFADRVSTAVTSTNVGSLETIQPNEVQRSSAGTFQRTYEFMNGFTLGRAWEWERRWNYPSGFFRVTFKAGLGFGIRIPIRADVRMSPQTHLLVNSSDEAVEFDTTVRLRTVDGNEDFYRRAGVDSGQIFEAKEFVLTAYIGYGLKLRALWDDLIYRPYREWGFDYGRDFTPVMGTSWDSIFEVFIPAHLTHTELSFGSLLRGSLQAGVQLSARGRISGQFRSLVDGQIVPSRYGGGSQETWRVDFLTPVQSSTWRTRVPALERQVSDTRTYGFAFGDLQYTTDWSVVPGAKLTVHAGIDGWSRTFQKTVWLDWARIELGSVTLNRHAGTRRFVNEQPGRRIFRNMYDVHPGGPG